MDHVEYVYTTGMSEPNIEKRLRAGAHGVLGLADANEAYATTLNYHYDGDRVILRVSQHGQDGEKARFLETTDLATFVCYEAPTSEESWSIHVRGPIQEWSSDVDEETINEWFPPFRLFGEAVDEVEFSLYELEMETVVGRQTVR